MTRNAGGVKPEYTITQEYGLTVVRGMMPIMEAAERMQRAADEGMELATEFNYRLRANWVYGTPEAKTQAWDALGMSIGPPEDVVGQPEAEQIKQFLERGRAGVSARTMACVFLGRDWQSMAPNGASPADAGDFWRCCLLLEWAPSCRERLDEMRVVSAAWAALVPHWESLTALLDEEWPSWRHEAPTARAPRLYQRLKAIVDPC